MRYHFGAAHTCSCYGTRSPLKNIRARGRIIFLFFPRAARALKIRQINNAIFKVYTRPLHPRARSRAIVGAGHEGVLRYTQAALVRSGVHTV